uniref:DUF3768 domain-containing protein n=1 Tax=unclassified Sphingomonas TaxID=196159 RepID=UPI0008341BEF
MRNPEHLEAIRRLNDAARSKPGVGSIANVTSGFHSLPAADRFAALAQIVGFTNFNGDNDPYGEHDFGAVYRLPNGRWTQERPTDEAMIITTVFWKVDLYDPGLVKFALNGSF